MPHWRLFYLVVWSMRGRAPKIDANVEDLLRKAIRSQCAGLGIPVHAIGTMPDHVHLAISIPPRLGVAKAVGRIKGSSAHLVNHAAPRPEHVAWEAEYSVHSFGARQLPEVVACVTDQRTRHAAQKVWHKMEPGAPRDEPA